MNNYLKTRIYQMAKNSGTEITPLHLDILKFSADYYDEHKVGPMYHLFHRKFNISKNDLDKLFPNGLFSVYTWVGIPIQTPDQICKHIAEVTVKQRREIYFDHNSTTPVRPEVAKIINDYMHGRFGFGNPGGANNPGREAYAVINSARIQLAKILRCSPEEIVFTGSGTEAINLAIKGIAFSYPGKKGHIITSKAEHPAVLETVKWLETLGFEITYLDINSAGIIEPQLLETSFRDNTILVCIMAVNNEIGTINPIEEIGKICVEKNVPFMSDAVQAFGKMHIHPKNSGIKLMPFSAHKIYAPKGIGALFIDKSLTLTPLIHGGGQEEGLRSGTENVAFIQAFAKAAYLIYMEMHHEHERLLELRNYFLNKLYYSGIEFIINGSLEKRLPNNLNIGFAGIDSGALLLSLNQIGVYVSAGSACHAGSKEASHVIKALGIDTASYGTIRFSFGMSNSKEDIDYLMEYLPEILRQLKEIGKNKE